MKKLRRLAALLLASIFTLPTITFAVNKRASDYIDAYDIDAVYTSDGEIAIKFSIEGKGDMDCLGAEEIIVYEKVNGIWMISDYFDRDDPGMVDTDTNIYTHTVYSHGYADAEYKILVSVFAEDSTGSDSRYEEVYVNT